MDIEAQYLAVLDLTHQMLAAAIAQDWNTLPGLESRRATIVAAIPPAPLSLEPALAKRIAGSINKIERESTEILEHVQTWREHVGILLRHDKAATA
jgi:hypothetical protein